MKKKNVIWFVIDGVRSYRSGIDDRDRIDVMDKLGKEAVEFTNAFTATPSSILAAATMFTGLPSVYISRHYNDFVFNDSEIDSIVTLLKDQSYNVYSIFDAKSLRCGLQDMAHSLPAKYRPKTSDHDKWWHNAEITNNVDHLFKKKYVKTPSFFLMWFNCRQDPNTSFEVERCINIFKENDLWDDSIVIMNSDHGYPDPSTGLTAETMKSYSHDMIITDDNSRVPLLIKYPDCPKGAKISNVVSTADIFHTLIEIMEMDHVDKTKMNYSDPYTGRSLINLINGEDKTPRIARIDTRIGVATHRVSALRSDKYKYVYHVDEDSEEFFDIIKDEYEVKNLIETKDKKLKKEISFFRNLYNEQNKNIFNYHEKVLFENFRNDLSKYYPNETLRFNVKRLLLSCTPTTPLPGLELLVTYLSDYFPNIKIDLLTAKSTKNKYSELDLLNIINLNKISDEDIKSSEIINNTYDFSIYLTEFSRYRFIDPTIVKALKLVKTRRALMMDFNFNLYSHMLSRWIYPIKRLLKRNWKYYKGEPLSYIVKDVSSLIYNGVMVNIFNKRAQTFDTEEIKQMRDHKLLSKTQKTPVGEINLDREKDRVLRLNLSKEKD